jgi:hypothetical protein
MKAQKLCVNKLFKTKGFEKSDQIYQHDVYTTRPPWRKVEWFIQNTSLTAAFRKPPATLKIVTVSRF